MFEIFYFLFAWMDHGKSLFMVSDPILYMFQPNFCFFFIKFLLCDVYLNVNIELYASFAYIQIGEPKYRIKLITCFLNEFLVFSSCMSKNSEIHKFYLH